MMPAEWTAPITLPDIAQSSPTVPVFTTSVELMSGETAGIEVVRTDGGLDEWFTTVQTSIDGVVYGLANQPPRILGAGFNTMNFPQDSIGVKFWRVKVGNAAQVGPSDLIEATIRYVLDGVQL